MAKTIETRTVPKLEEDGFSGFITEKHEMTPEEWMNEEVEYTAPLTSLDDKPILAGVNGEVIRIQRGMPVKIKRKYYEALMRAQDQEIASIKAQRDAQNASLKPLAEM